MVEMPKFLLPFYLQQYYKYFPKAGCLPFVYVVAPPKKRGDLPLSLLFY